MKHKFCGKNYEIIFTNDVPDDSYGLCDSPKDKNPSIKISSDLIDKKKLEITLHESIHACEWKLSESKVRKMSEDIAKLLWKLGYREK